MSPFEKELQEKGIPKSRLDSLYRACSEMHRALCGLDLTNLTIIRDLTLEGMMDLFSESSEGLRHVFKGMVEQTVIPVDLKKVKAAMKRSGYNHETDEEDCWTNTLMDSLQDETGLEETLREMFKEEE